MKQLNLFIMLITMMAIFSCKKDKPGNSTPNPVDTTLVPPPAGDTAEIPLEDTARFLLKDIVGSNLPTPYYHFVYDNEHYVTEISFAANLDIFRLTYSDKRLQTVTNINHGNQLSYSYTGDMVTLVTERNDSGVKTWEYQMEYNSLHQLIQMRWIQFTNGVTASPYKKYVFSYGANGNLVKTERYFRQPSGALEWSSTTEYKDFDNNTSTDDFALNKDFFESLVYLPKVRLMKNNYRTEITTGIDNDYRTTYTYQYNNQRPVSKAGIMTQTRGTNAGQTFSFNWQISYYN
ncbi:MAG: hypothetical protein JST81_00810 [Bacteroidetes bacterium]|nr:hypothetical protein [Bacteroidota bacterium]